MYPNLYYLFKDVFGISLPFLKAISSAGFFMALAFLPGAWLWERELKRQERIGNLTYINKKIIVGKGPDVQRIILHFLVGFIAGYKLIGLFVNASNRQNNADYFFSFEGNFIGGFLIAFLWSCITYFQGRKEKSDQPHEEIIPVYPHEYVPKAVLVAAISGIVGAKIFGVLEDWSRFIKNPLSTLFSSEGFAYLGGFIIATFAMWFYHYKFGALRMRMADALAPSLILSYALGRLGCHISGDGDWGINNLKPKPFSWLPDWLWSYNYPHNILHKGIYMQNCNWDDFCYRLAVGVYPTPLYEMIIGFIIFSILMFLRKRVKLAGHLSAFFLMLMSTERFFIEMIRVDVRYNFLGMHPTQSQLLSVFCFCCGVFLYFISPKLNANKLPVPHQ